MKKPGAIKSWLIWLFIVACILTISISIAILLVRFEILQPLGAAIVGLLTFGGFIFFQRQITMSNDIKDLRAQAGGLSDFENGVAQKIEKLSLQISAGSDRGDFKNEHEQATLQAKVSELEDRLIVLERDPSALPSASMVPFHEASQQSELKEVEAAAPSEITPTKTSLQSALKEDNLQMHLQPIVGLPSRSPAYFEAFMQLKTGHEEFLDTAEFNRLAEDGGLMPAIDTKILFSSARLIRTLEGLKKSAGLFCSLSASTFKNEKTFSQIVDFLEANQAINKSLILEITQRNYVALKPKGRARLGQIADLGFSLSLSEVADLALDVKKLSGQGFRFVKLPASILLHANLNENDIGIHPSRLSTTLQDQGITLIALGVEQENQAISLIDLDVRYAQGLLFAPPRAVKAELLNTT